MSKSRITNATMATDIVYALFNRDPDKPMTAVMVKKHRQLVRLGRRELSMSHDLALTILRQRGKGRPV